MIYLTLPELLRVAEWVLGPDVKTRDIGLLEAALARRQTTVFGADAYPTLNEKAETRTQDPEHDTAEVERPGAGARAGR
jgi:death-on-curing protein